MAVFVALYNSLDDTGRQTLLRYARGEVLDAIGERLDVHRLEGSPAKTTMRFSVSTPQPNNIIIPKWTKVTPDSDHYFATDEIAVLQAGAYSVEIPTSAVSNGTEYNGYAPGTITTLVDLIPYIESVHQHHGDGRRRRRRALHRGRRQPAARAHPTGAGVPVYGRAGTGLHLRGHDGRQLHHRRPGRQRDEKPSAAPSRSTTATPSSAAAGCCRTP